MIKSARVLISIKFIITLGLWAGPLLLAPNSFFTFLGFPPVSIFIRLLGAAYATLLLIYLRGWIDAGKEKYPQLAVEVGVMSNAVASAVLVANAVIGTWSSFGTGASLFLWASTIITTGLAIAFALNLVLYHSKRLK